MCMAVLAVYSIKTQNQQHFRLNAAHQLNRPKLIHILSCVWHSNDENTPIHKRLCTFYLAIDHTAPMASEATTAHLLLQSWSKYWNTFLMAFDVVYIGVVANMKAISVWCLSFCDKHTVSARADFGIESKMDIMRKWICVYLSRIFEARKWTIAFDCASNDSIVTRICVLSVFCKVFLPNLIHIKHKTNCHFRLLTQLFASRTSLLLHILHSWQYKVWNWVLVFGKWYTHFDWRWFSIDGAIPWNAFLFKM